MSSKRPEQLEYIHNMDIDPFTRTIYLCSQNDEGHLADDVNYYMATRLAKNLNFLSSSRDPITIFLNTTGGEVDQGMLIYDLIKACPAFVTMVAMGTCQSMGMYILQAADRRLLTPNCQLLMHHGSATGSGGYTTYEAISAAHAEHAHGAAADLILLEAIRKKLSETGQSITHRKFEQMMLKGTYLNSKQAIEYGLADAIYEGVL